MLSKQGNFCKFRTYRYIRILLALKILFYRSIETDNVQRTAMCDMFRCLKCAYRSLSGRHKQTPSRPRDFECEPEM